MPTPCEALSLTSCACIVEPPSMNSTSQGQLSNPGLSPVPTAAAGLLVALFVYLSVSYFRSPLRRYPGPFLASRSTPGFPFPPHTQQEITNKRPLRIHQPMAPVAGHQRKHPHGADRSSQEIRPRGARRPKYHQRGLPRVDQDRLQHQGRLEEGTYIGMLPPLVLQAPNPLPDRNVPRQ